MKPKSTTPHTSAKVALYSLFTVTFLLLLGLVVVSFANSAKANSGNSAIYLPVISTTRVFEANLISSDFGAISHITNAGDDRLFIAERDGRIRIWHPNQTITDFLDIRDRVQCCNGEEGLFALAFHPNYAVNGYFFVSYIGEEDGDHKLIVDRFKVTANPDVADPNSAERIFNLGQDSPLHNGGGLAFHPITGNLFLGTGDDQGLLIAQEGSYKGKIVELYVNEFPNVGRVIYARGVRNPWRLSFDPITADLFIAEVGDDSWEEVNLIPNGSINMNFGWPCYEGYDQILDCANNHTRPIYAYPHHPARAIVGGPVYRESINDPPQYIFGDFATKEIFTLEPVGGIYLPTLEGSVPSEMDFLYTFGIGNDGTLYAGGFGGGLFEIYIPPH